MAHIVSFSIDGLLDRKTPLKQTLKRDVNIFFGENGCGKTTLLKIFDAALSRDARAISTLPVAKAEVEIYSITEDATIKHTWERTSKTGASSSELEDPARLEFYASLPENHPEKVKRFGSWKLSPAPKKPDSSRWAHTFLPTTRLYLPDFANKNSQPRATSESQLDALFADTLKRAWLLVYSKVLSDIRGIQEDGLTRVLHEALSPNKKIDSTKKLRPEEAYARTRKFLDRQKKAVGETILGSPAQFSSRYATSIELQRIVSNLDNVEGRIDGVVAPIERLKAAVNELFSGGKTLTAAEDLAVRLESGQLLSPAALSSGEKHLLKILLATMTANQNSILIDEPELSMHINWQRAFVKTLRAVNADCQLILASHSPEVMADIPDKNIFRL